MKRLFALRNAQHQPVLNEDGKPMYFADKTAARAYRSKLTQESGVYFVTYGIDHDLYKGAK